MAKPPPAPIRWLVLLGAVALLATAVCSKTEKADQPENPQAVEPAAEPEEVDQPVEEGENEADAGQAAAPQQANPPPTKNSKGNKGEKEEPEFFPASKSAGGIF